MANMKNMQNKDTSEHGGMHHLQQNPQAQRQLGKTKMTLQYFLE